MHRIYLDYAATTPVDPAVNDVMVEYAIENYGNASSVHELGLTSRKAIELTRWSIARFLKIQPECILFTGSGTESDNMALQGIMHRHRDAHPHLITCNIEHPAIYNTAKFLESQGFEVSIISVNSEGFVSISDIEQAIKPNTKLISIHYVNNEIGTIQPIKEIGKVAQKHQIYFHTDAVQAFGKLPIHMINENIDLLSFAGHKIYGPKGIGGLCANPKRFISAKEKAIDWQKYLQPLMFGGSQEYNFRPSTENVPAIAGLGKAVELAQERMKDDAFRIEKLRDYFIDRILKEIPNSALNGSHNNRIFNNVNMRFDGINGYDALLMLDAQGISVSTGSACSSKSKNPSRILTALGLNPDEATSSIRFTLGRQTTQEDLDFVIEHLIKIMKRLRSIS